MATKPAARKVVTYSKGSRDQNGSKAPTPRPHARKPSADDLYDFPDSDDGAPAPKLVRRIGKAVTPAKRPQTVVRQQPKAQIDDYDFPGSEDELATPRPLTKATPAKGKADLKTQTPRRVQSQAPTQRAKPNIGKPDRTPPIAKKPSPPTRPVQRSDDESRKRNHTNAFETDKAEKARERSIATPRRPAGRPPKPVASAPPGQSKITRFATPGAKTPTRVSPKQTPNPAPAPTARPIILPTAKPLRSPLLKPQPQPRPRSPTRENRLEPAAERPRKKVRLIDTLASQLDSSSESESDEEADVSTSGGGTDRTPNVTSQAPSQTPVSQSSARYGRETWSRPGTLVNKKVKVTYSQANLSIRQESESQPQTLGGAMDLLQDSLVSSPSPPRLGDEFDLDSDEADVPKNGIKSLHELRRAGANSRFGDEMEDLLSRIGQPGSENTSMRRNALLDLAQKLQRNDFAAQVRDHAGRDSIATEIGKESELVSAFALAAALTIFLSSHNAPNMLKRLVDENVGKLLARLLRQAEDIEVIAKKRESNLSKVGRASVNKVKAHLVDMRIWHGCKLTDLSPRTVGLRLLHILQQNLDLRGQSDVFRQLDTELSEAAATHARNDSPDDIEFVLAALVMEAESGADTVAVGQDQVARQAATSAHLLRKTLPRWPSEVGEVPTAILKLAINTTNTDLGAKAFSHGEILAGLAGCIDEGLRRVQAAVSKGALRDGLYHGLLLNLGVLINILEHCPASRSTMDDESLRRLAKLYLDIRPSAMDADTEEKSKVSVAVGYLAVVLGYLCLDERGRKAMERNSQRNAMRVLTNSIQHFMELYRSVDTRVHELEGLVVQLQRYSNSTSR